MLFNFAWLQIKYELLNHFSGSAFDLLGQARGPAPPLEAKTEDRCASPCAVALLLLHIFYFNFPNMQFLSILKVYVSRIVMKASSPVLETSKRLKSKKNSNLCSVHFYCNTI